MYCGRIAAAGKRFGISDNPQKVCWNRNSGAAAISLAALFGVTKIFLLGFDMRPGTKDFTHWHGHHGKRIARPPYKSHLMGFKQISMDAKRMGIEILNVNDKSAITELPQISLKEALNIV